jgi:hypothetical protein
MDSENNDLHGDAGSGEEKLPVVPVSFIKAADLVPYARNARKHSEANVAKLIGLIGEFGWTNPVLVEGKSIVAGHGRTLAALKIYADGGLISLPNKQMIPEGMVPCIDCTGWTEGQRRAYVIADNRSTLDSEWDDGLLEAEMLDLDGLGFDLEMTGFETDEINRIIGGDGTKDKSKSEGEELPNFDYKAQFGVTVVCKTEAEQETVYNQLIALGLDAKVVST